MNIDYAENDSDYNPAELEQNEDDFTEKNFKIGIKKRNNFRENDFTKKLSSSKLPVSSSSSNPRRLSLSPVKPKSVNMVDTSPMTAPVMSQMR